MQFEQELLVNSICLVWFFICWVGYTFYARNRASRQSCLASELHNYREYWMRRVLLRDIRVGDAALIANLERNVSFLASTTILILAGLLTVFAVSDQISDLVSQIPFAMSASLLSVQLKILMLVVIFVYAFFTFTWSMRQYGFCSIVLGAAPMVDEDGVTADERERYAFYAARVIDLAGLSYNHGLRAYYFALSILAWFISPYLFILTSSFVVAVLYRREFKSRSLLALKQIDSAHEHPANI
jgi:uncharacterized membrane protein